jgi:hypothetical protein
VGGLIQLFITLGITLGYFVCYETLGINGPLSWRLPYISQVVVSTILCVGSALLPHSPRWLLRVGRSKEAEAALLKLGTASVGETEELFATLGEKAGTPRCNSLVHDAKLVWGKDVRGRTALATFMSAFQQFTGIDALLYYAPILFTQAGLSDKNTSFLAGGVSGLVAILCTVVAQVYTDRW